MLADKSISVIGVGKLGEALISGLINSNTVSKNNITGSVAHENSRDSLREKLGIDILLDNRALIRGKDIVILALKPQKMAQVLNEIKDIVTENQLIISVAASMTISCIKQYIKKDLSIIRAMPNIPCLVGEGMTVLSKNSISSEEHCALAEAIFSSIGDTVFLDESLMNGVTGLSACGPAYMFVVIEALAEAGVKLGIPRDISTLLVAQTMLGSAKMIIDSKEHPALLKDMVTTPAGCTIDGLIELEEGKLRVTLIKAVVRSAERASELISE